MGADDLIKSLQDFYFDHKNRVLVLKVTTPTEAQALFSDKKAALPLAKSALKFLRYGFKGIAIKHADCKPDEFAYFIPASMAARKSKTRRIFNGGESMPVEEAGTVISALRNGRPDLRDATRRQVLDFLEDQREAGKIVVVTSNLTNRCLDITDMSPERGIFAYTSQWHGLNFLELWRESMDQYFHLINLLNSDGYIPGFVYDLLRIDGSKGRYCKDYYLARNLIPNEEVRISISDKANNSWELVRPALN